MIDLEEIEEIEARCNATEYGAPTWTAREAARTDIRTLIARVLELESKLKFATKELIAKDTTVMCRERERCAKLCEDISVTCDYSATGAALYCAKAIRGVK